MDMPTMPGLMGATSAPETIAEILDSMSEEDIAGLVELVRTAGSDPGDEAEGDEPDETDLSGNPAPTPDPEEDGAPAGSTAQNPGEEAPETDPVDPTGLGNADSYAASVASAVDRVAAFATQAQTLLEGAQEHEEAGLDPSVVEDAIAAIEEAQQAVEDAQAACADADGDEPDLGAMATAAHAAQTAVEQAQAAYEAAETALQEAAASASDPAVQAMQAWADQTLARKL